jgi:hypothetical protein
VDELSQACLQNRDLEGEARDNSRRILEIQMNGECIGLLPPLSTFLLIYLCFRHGA